MGAAPSLPAARLADAALPVGVEVCTRHASADGSVMAGVVRTVTTLERSYPAAATGGGRDWSGDDPGPGVLHAFGTLAELDPPPPPGCSGGGAFDGDGALVGLLLEPSPGDALPPRMVPLSGSLRRTVDALLVGRTAEYGLLGVEPMTVTADAAFAMLGDGAPPGAAVLEDVRGNSPAERAGLRRGEWITSFQGFDGQSAPVRSASDLVRLVALSPPGAVVTYEVLSPHSGERRTATATLAAAATGRAAGGWPAVALVPRGVSARGVRVDWSTAATLTAPGEPLPSGVSVVGIDAPPGPADASAVRGVRVGDRVEAVNERSVASPEEFASRLAEAPSPALLRLSDGSTVRLP